MTGSEALRVALILVIALAGWRCLHLLLRDWSIIEPRYWRLVIAAFHFVLCATGVAVAIALTIGTHITAATWVMLAAHAALVAVAFVAPYTDHPRR